mmetsp:Transcript_7596/g.11278  ORF Transcript_7596/g.11278 Transcript_7596/m.11278 type:complete len:188 (+) Transcript_7596:101-664(+)
MGLTRKYREYVTERPNTPPTEATTTFETLTKNKDSLLLRSPAALNTTTTGTKTTKQCCTPIATPTPMKYECITKQQGNYHHHHINHTKHINHTNQNDYRQYQQHEQEQEERTEETQMIQKKVKRHKTNTTTISTILKRTLKKRREQQARVRTARCKEFVAAKLLECCVALGNVHITERKTPLYYTHE